MQGKVLQDMCKDNVEILPPAAMLLTWTQGHLPHCHLSSCPSPPPPLLIPSCSASHSVMSGSLPSVSNQLESANDLTDSEETQQLSSNDSASSKLGSADIADTLEDVGWVGAERDERVGVSDALDELLEVGLEGGNGTKLKSAKLCLCRI
jgi:hypothetical protein